MHDTEKVKKKLKILQCRRSECRFFRRYYQKGVLRVGLYFFLFLSFKLFFVVVISLKVSNIKRRRNRQKLKGGCLYLGSELKKLSDEERYEYFEISTSYTYSYISRTFSHFITNCSLVTACASKFEYSDRHTLEA